MLMILVSVSLCVLSLLIARTCKFLLYSLAYSLAAISLFATIELHFSPLGHFIAGSVDLLRRFAIRQ